MHWKSYTGSSAVSIDVSNAIKDGIKLKRPPVSSLDFDWGGFAVVQSLDDQHQAFLERAGMQICRSHPVVPEPAKLGRLRDEPVHLWAKDWSSSRAWVV
jgi:hypothetical protein